MKKIFTIFLLSFSSFSVFSQAPEKMSYQAVIRGTNNALLTSQNVGVRISILQGSISGSAVYVETQSPTTNANGLLSIEIGGGTVVSGTFGNIDWSNGPFFIKTETDPAGGTSYTITGTSQLMSVPYALYAKTSGSSTPGPQGIAGTNGQNTLVRSTPEAAGANCATGGIRLEYGLDANNDGVLDASEVNDLFTSYVCNGAEGGQGAPGTNGINGNDGVDGTNGTNGTNGLNSLSKTTAEAAGANCATGGIKVEYGLDANGNGTLDASEITASLTRYVCNGAQGIQGIQGAAGTNGTNGAAGANGTNGTNGLNSLSKTTAEAAGANCATGGIKVEYGLDANGNGTLDASEINASLTRYVCNGAQGIQGIQGAAGTNGTNGAAGTNGTNGLNSLSKTTAEAAGTNCATGGIKVEYGLDANGNGTLDASEITASLTRYVCNGAQGIQGIQGAAGTNGTNGAAGTNGTNGTNGLNSLSKTTAEAAGANCATGGIKVEYGLDANGNGTLDASEITASLTRYVCNGAQGIQGIQGAAGTNGTNGTNGLNSLSKTTAEAAGANCATGGTKVEFGLDANGNGTLDAGEVNASLTRYVCNGAQGTTGTTGANGKNTIVKTTTEPAGSNCPGGGVKLEYGLDANSNGTLDAAEIDAALTKYVCNGDPGQHPVFLQTNSTIPFPSLNIGKGILMMVKVYTQCSSTATGGLIFIQNTGEVSVLTSAGSQGSYFSASGNVLSLVNGCVAPWTWTFAVSGGTATVTQGGASGLYQEAKWQILGN